MLRLECDVHSVDEPWRVSVEQKAHMREVLPFEPSRKVELSDVDAFENEFHGTSFCLKYLDGASVDHSPWKVSNLGGLVAWQKMPEFRGTDAYRIHVSLLSLGLWEFRRYPDVTSGPDMALTFWKGGPKNHCGHLPSLWCEKWSRLHGMSYREEDVPLCARKRALSCRAFLARILGAPSRKGIRLCLWYPLISS